jgi:hypothetical protein
LGAADLFGVALFAVLVSLFSANVSRIRFHGLTVAAERANLEQHVQ